MTIPRERVEADLKTAMKARDTERLAVLRMLLAAVKNEAIERGGELDEAGFVQVVRRSVKQRQEAAEQFRRGGREESAAREEREAGILDEYLPEPVSDDELRRAVSEIVAERDLSGPAAMGPVMKEMMARYGTRADGAAISRVARDVLTSSSS